MGILPYQIAEPDEALLVTGARARKDGPTEYKIVVGGGCWVVPFFRKAKRLGLQAHETPLRESVRTKDGIPLDVEAVVVFKVAGDKTSIANAAQRFMDREEDMDKKAQNVFTGHLRSIVGEMTPEEILRERTKLAEGVRAASADEMQLYGFTIDSFQIKEVGDRTGYYDQLMAPEQARVAAEARIAQAERDQEATEKEQLVAAAKAQAIASSAVQQAERKAEAETAQSTAEQAGPLASAKAKMDVVRQETEVAELEAARRERQLLVEVVRPAEAQREADVAKADGEQQVTVLQAKGEAQKVELAAAAEAKRIELTAAAEAGRERSIGEAKGAAKLAELSAEAQGIALRSDALAKNQDAVIGLKAAENLPQIVEAAAKAFEGIDSLTVFDGAEGMSSFIKEVAGVGLAILPLVQNALAKKAPQD